MVLINIDFVSLSKTPDSRGFMHIDTQGPGNGKGCKATMDFTILVIARNKQSVFE
jgi:hypothetical protein